MLVSASESLRGCSIRKRHW